jgi:cyanophycin synthetase
VPVPQGRAAKDADEAWEIAQDLGLPVVVKPSDGNHGRGVSLDLTSEAEVRAAFALAEPEGSEVLVERFIAGDEHRLLVVGGKVVAAARGECLGGHRRPLHSVQQLIDPRSTPTRAAGYDRGLPARNRRGPRGPGGAANWQAPGPAHAERARAWAAGA